MIGDVAGGVLGLALGHLVGEHRLVGPRGREAVEPARDDVQPRGDVAAARQREPQVERPHLAHERAVLVPGAADGRLGLAQRRLLHGDQRRLAEVAGDERRDAGGLEQLEHLEAQQRRVDRQHAAALLDPRPLVDRAEARMRRRTPRTSPRRRVAVAALALLEGAVDAPRANASAASRGDEPAHEQAAVAQDPGAQQLGGEVRGARCPAARRPRAGGRTPAPGMPGSGGAPSSRRMPARWRRRQQPGARWPGRGRRGWPR